jgi:hypothetical protein
MQRPLLQMAGSSLPARTAPTSPIGCKLVREVTVGRPNSFLSKGHRNSNADFMGTTASLFEVSYKTLFQKISSAHSTSLNDLSHINLTLGPHGSYFTRTKHGALWRDLPPDLEEEIAQKQKNGVSPRQVALGRRNSYVCIWSDDRWSYHLRGGGDGFADLIAKFEHYERTGERVAFVALDPFETDSWFVVDCDGVISSSWRGMKNENVDRIHALSMAYMQRRARKTGLTFTNKLTRGDRLRSFFTGARSGRETQFVEITPHTTFDQQPSLLRSRLMDPLNNIRAAAAGVGPRGRWRQPVFAAGVIGLSTGAICKYYGLPLGPAVLSGVTAGLFTAGYIAALN